MFHIVEGGLGDHAETHHEEVCVRVGQPENMILFHAKGIKIIGSKRFMSCFVPLFYKKYHSPATEDIRVWV